MIYSLTFYVAPISGQATFKAREVHYIIFTIGL